MPILSLLWILVCLAGIVLSVKSIVVLGPRSPATRLGWLSTAIYFAIATADALRSAAAPFHIDYIALGALTVAFVLAAIRDEPQAEPWWWPERAGLTGAERRQRDP